MTIWTGVILISAGGGTQSLLRPIITSSISPEDISLVCSVLTILHRISGSLAGPLYSGTFTIGLNLGVFRTGLSFLVASGLVVLAVNCSMSVKENFSDEQIPEDDLEP